MKKIAVIMLAVLLFCAPCMAASAAGSSSDSATVTANVPATHRVTFIFHGGRGEENGVGLKEAADYYRQSIHTYHFIPDEGKSVDKVLYGGKDVTAQVRDGYFTAPPLTADMVLEVFFKDTGTPAPAVSEPTSEAGAESSGSDSSKPDTIRRDDTSKPEHSGNSDTSMPQDSDTAKTGDTTTVNVFVSAFITAISAAFIIVLARSRRKNI